MDELDLAVASAVVRFTFIGGKDFDKGIFFWGGPNFLNLCSAVFESVFLLNPSAGTISVILR